MKELKRKIKTIITAITGDRVVVTVDEIKHAMKHFTLPEDIFLELLERVLKAPTEIFLDDRHEEKSYYLFYRLDSERYIVAVVKIIHDGNYFASMYTTGSKIRNPHRKLKKVKI